jgi:endonuclease YncB( thermonuclease family)
VIDGDTIAIGSERLRLEGIDAPEMSQSCTRGGRDYRCGDSARDALRRILGRGMVSCDALGRDVFNRQLVVCHGEDGRDLGAAMVAAGWAVAFTRYSDRYVAEERSARAQRLGLWEGEFETPSDYRRRNR